MNKNFGPHFRRIWDEIKWAALGLLWLISLSLGYLGFTTYTMENDLSFSIMDRLYLSLQLISMNSGVVEGSVNWMLEIGRFLVPALTAFTAFQAIINLFREQTQWWHLWGLRDHIIVCGLGRKGSYLIDDLISKGQHLVAIEKHIEPATADEYRRKGVIVIAGDAADPDTLETARLSRASHLICLLGNDQQNLSIALQAHQLVKAIRRKNLTCIVHLVSENLLNLVTKSQLNINKDDPFSLEIFNTYKQTSHTLVDHISTQHPIQSNILVVGMGRLGQNIIREAAYQRYPQRASEKLNITVIDRDANAKVESLLTDYPQIASVCELNPIQLDLCSSLMLKNALAEHANQAKLDHVFICLGNPILSIQVSLTLLETTIFSEVPFFIRLEKNSGLINLLENPIIGQIDKELIVPFDMYEKTCSVDLIIGGLHEMLAIKLRENYLQSLDPEKPNDQGKIPWEAISEEEKDANRQQAKRICYLLDACGFSVNPLHNWGAGQFTFKPEEIQQMAKMEHSLWCNWKRDEGWQFGTQRDKQKKTHPDLVPWDELPDNEQRKNLDFIIKLPALLAELGFQIDKMT